MASVRKLPDGRWQAQFRPVPGGKQVTRTTARKVDAQRWLDEQTASVVNGQFVDPQAGRVTFRAYFDQWSQRQVWETGTARAMRLAVSSASFADVRMSMLRRAHIESWVKAMQVADRGPGRTRGLAPGTIRTRFSNVRTVLRSAVRDRVISTDPSEGVRLPRMRRRDAAMALPTSAQVRALLDATEGQYRLFLALCAFAGLRLGEAAGVQVGDIDFVAETLQVSRQVQRENGGGAEVRPPKYGSERTVYLAPWLVEQLRVHIAGLAAGASWIFIGEGAGPPHQNTVGYWWRRARAAAGCPAMRLHDLRHFYASGLIAAGCDVVTVQRALGHHSATITLSTYAHLWPKAEDRTRAAAARLVVEALTNG